MRLIDADNFRRFAHEQLEGNKTYSIDEILEMIDEQPTAYDVEKVVAELEDDLPFIEADDGGGTFIHKASAIEIVRKGGVE